MASYAQACAVSKIKKVWYEEDYPVGFAVRWSKEDASQFISAHKTLSYRNLRSVEPNEEEVVAILKKWRRYDPLKGKHEKQEDCGA